MFGPFDFDGNGKVDAFEFAMGMSILEALEGEEQQEDLEAEGLDFDELEAMDESERNEILEDAGLDPDDYDF